MKIVEALVDENLRIIHSNRCLWAEWGLSGITFIVSEQNSWRRSSFDVQIISTTDEDAAVAELLNTK